MPDEITAVVRSDTEVFIPRSYIRSDVRLVDIERAVTASFISWTNTGWVATFTGRSDHEYLLNQVVQQLKYLRRPRT